MVLSDIKSQIKSRIDLVELVRSRGIDLKRRGRTYTACCPFHREKTPSFNVTSEGFYKCFGCTRGGDHFSFLMELDKLSFYEAFEVLAKMAKVEMPTRLGNGFRDPIFEDKKALANLNSRLVLMFIYFYTNEKTSSAKVYLERRGFNSREIIQKFSIGFLPYVGDWLRNFLLSKGFSLDLLGRSGIFSIGARYSLMGGRLIFPIRDLQGIVLGFGGRTLDTSEPKYFNSRDDVLFKKKNVLYGFYEAINEIRQKKIAIICEGYMDVLAWHSSGIKIAVAPLGTSFTYEQASLLKRFIGKIIFCFDSDKAGVNATLKSFLMVESLGLESEVIVMSSGEDPADILQKKGTEALITLYKTGRVPTFTYLLDHLLLKNMKYERGEVSILYKLFKIVQNNPSEISRERKLNLIGKKLFLSFSSLKRDFYNWLEAGMIDKRSQKEFINRWNTGFPLSYERLLLKGIINHPRVFRKVRRYLIADDLQEESMRMLYALLEKIWKIDNQTLKLNRIFEELEETPELKMFFLNAILADETPMSHLDLLQTTFTIYGALLEKKRSSLKDAIERAEYQGLAMAPLMGTLQFLNQRIEQFNRSRDKCLSQLEEQISGGSLRSQRCWTKT